MEFQHLGTKYVIENGLIKCYNKKNEIEQIIIIKQIAWIWNHTFLKRLEIHTSGGDPVPFYYREPNQAKEILEEIYKYL